MNSVRELEPSPLWNHFADLNEVPRPSKQEERVIEFAKQFGISLGFDTTVDHVGNVIIRKPATSGMEDRATIVMQSHLDMVCQKNADVEFDFENQGIDMYVDGDWVRARGTTLGADNGIGVATIMAILSSTDIPHPAIEALFTIDEETGMTGAKGLQGGVLTGEIMLNLDTEDDNELTIGCAGGIDVSTSLEFEYQPTDADTFGAEIFVRGLKGGHSGMDIHLGRGNANKLMNRILWNASQQFDLRIASIDGGGLRNAIPRESFAHITLPNDQLPSFQVWFNGVIGSIKAEYQSTDSELKIGFKTGEPHKFVLAKELQDRLLGVIYACPNGIFRLSPDIDDLVQTSNNLARVVVNEGKVQIDCLTRSSVNSERDDLANSITALFQWLEGSTKTSGAYPGWQPSPGSPIVSLMSNLYEEMFAESAHVAACHAGLECGIVGTNYPNMQMISFGPNIRGAHSPDECVQISSVQKFWRFLLETLKRIPAGT